jgi:hypothetical protein
MTRKIYNYHPDTGEYLAQSRADESPLEPGVYLLPAHSTDLAPPQPPDKMVAVFRGGAWHVEEDHRGKTYWLADGSRHTVSAIGPTPADALNKAPEPPPSQIALSKRIARNAALARTDWLVIRHQDDLLSARAPTLNETQLDAVLSYRKALRDLPSTQHWPFVDLPVTPDFAIVVL